jgi:hypothetical protein
MGKVFERDKKIEAFHGESNAPQSFRPEAAKRTHINQARPLLDSCALCVSETSGLLALPKPSPRLGRFPVGKIRARLAFAARL